MEDVLARAEKKNFFFDETITRLAPASSDELMAAPPKNISPKNVKIWPISELPPYNCRWRFRLMHAPVSRVRWPEEFWETNMFQPVQAATIPPRPPVTVDGRGRIACSGEWPESASTLPLRHTASAQHPDRPGFNIYSIFFPPLFFLSRPGGRR